MNGRVYGARRASELAELQKQQREAAEPEFVEWGNAKPEAASTGRGFLGDDDDGGGMEWVRRRREERQKKEAEKREREAKSENVNEEKPPLLQTHSLPDAPVTPVIQISEPVEAKATTDVFDDDPEDDEEEGDDGDFSSDEEEEEDATR